MAEERKDHLWKVAQEAEERIDDLMKTGASPMGLDVGTTKVVASRRKGKDIESAAAAQRLHPGPLLEVHRDDPRARTTSRTTARARSW